MTKRIAVSATDNRGLESAISNHFGRCPYFIIAEIEEDAIISIEAIENPFFNSHQPGQVPAFIHGHRVNVMLTGGMGHRAISFFQENDIQPITGASGTVHKTLHRYLNGELFDTQPCAESQKHQEHHH